MPRARAIVSAVRVAALIIAAMSCSSPDGPNGPRALRNEIVFVSNRLGVDQLFVMNADGSEQVQLTNIAGAKVWPAISPDGRLIAFSTGSIQQGGFSTLYVMSSDGSNLHALTTASSLNYRPSWSPDGSQIAFGSSRDGDEEIYTMMADGSGQVNRTNTPDALDFDPAWRPVGNSILLASDRNDPGNSYTIFSMTPSGDSVVPLVDGLQPEWSPSGNRFLYKTSTETWISLTPDASSTMFLFADAPRHYTPSWSPDESRLAFSLRDTELHEQIWTMSVAGGDERQLTTQDQGNNSYPTWSRH
jgi:Tol biopolymer transport system component